MGVFHIEDIGKGHKKAVVARPRDCTMCRECLRDDWDKKVKLQRIKDHFICKKTGQSKGGRRYSTTHKILTYSPSLYADSLVCVQSTGILKPDEIFEEACLIFKEKCQRILQELQNNGK